MTFNDGQIRRRIDPQVTSLAVSVGGVRFAAAGNCGRIRYELGALLATFTVRLIAE